MNLAMILSCGLVYESRTNKVELVLEDLASTLLSEWNLILFLHMNVIKINGTKLPPKKKKEKIGKCYHSSIINNFNLNYK